MSTQIALALTEIGKPLTKISRPGPDTFELAPNDVLIKLTAVGCQLVPYSENHIALFAPLIELPHLTKIIHQWHLMIKSSAIRT